MIKINLLSDRDAIRKETTRQQLSIYILSIVFTIVVAGAVQFTFYQKKKGIQEEIQKVEATLKQLKEKVAEVEKYKQFKKELVTKLEVIKDLQKSKILSVELLDTLSQKIPERMWLGKLAKKGTDMTLEGYAIDNETIAGFMKGLEGSPFIGNVELRLTENKDIQGVSLKHFLIAASVLLSLDKKPPEPNEKPLGSDTGTPGGRPPPQADGKGSS